MEEIKQIVQPVPETIETIFKNVYQIPVFQRPYKWGKDEIEEFINDLIDAQTQNKHWFAGTLYIKLKNKINSSLYEYDIIDGQQRLTTVTAILIVMQTLFLKSKEPNAKEVIKDIQEKLYKEDKYLIENEGLEKGIVKDIFENACQDPINVMERLQIYHNKNKIEKDFKEKFQFIYMKMEELQKNINFKDLYQFMKEKMIFITITVNLPYNEMFEIFDAINSKGKALDEIDKIKSYIFRNLDENDYNTYLKKWGELIEKTEDNLEDYLYIFIKAYIKYYKATGMKYFKAFCNHELKQYYNKKELSEALKAFIDDLYKYVEVYTDMKKSKLPYKNNKAQFYIKAINHLKYIHPLPLIFRTLCENRYAQLEKEKASKLIKEAFIFMFHFQTMNERDSKETQEVFAKLMPQLYDKKIDVDYIIQIFKSTLQDRGITQETMKRKLSEHISFIDKAKRESYILLMFYEFSDQKGKVDYDKMTWTIDHKDIIQVDHILPINPEKEKNFQYEKMIVEGEEKLVLKSKNDFEQVPGIYNGMEYIEFKIKILDKIGNLQLCWRKDNLEKSNKFIKLTDYSNYRTYTQTQRRVKDMINKLANTELFKIT